MNKKYTLYQAKKWIIYFVIITVVMVVIYLYGVLNVDVGVYLDTYSGNWRFGSYSYASSAFDYIAYPALILSVIPPFFVYSDRTSRTRTDTYRQTPFSQRSLRTHKLLIALVMYFAAIIVTFLIGILFFGIEIATFETSEIRRVQTYNFGYYILALLVLLVECGLAYFVNCFFVSLGNNAVTQVVFLACGSLFLAFLPNLAEGYIYLGDADISLYNLSFTQFYSLSWMDSIFEPLICEYTTYNGLNDNYLTNIIVSIVVTHVVGAGCGFLCFFLKDPSGEKAGTPGCYCLPIRLIVPLTFVVFYISMYTWGFGILSAVFTILMLVLHYVVLILVNKSPKLDKYDLIFNLSAIGLVLLWFGILGICNHFDRYVDTEETVTLINGVMNALHG